MSTKVWKVIIIVNMCVGGGGGGRYGIKISSRGK